MNLTETHRDALSELAHIGFGRAADSLSQLTGQRIALQVPRLKLAGISEIISELGEALPGHVACVDQPFTGPIAGNGLLLMDQPAAIQLTSILGVEATEFDENVLAREALTEVGNIVLNACLGGFDNLFGVPVSFAVPSVAIVPVEQVFRMISAGALPSTPALLLQTQLELPGRAVCGYLVVMPTLTSVERLVSEIALWETRQ